MKIEDELTKATNFKPPKGGFNDRQDELAALARAARKLDDDDFDELTDEAADWANTAVKAIVEKTPIPEFKDLGEEAEAEEAEETPPEDEPAEDEPEDIEDEEPDEEPEDEDVDHEAEEAEEARVAKTKATPKPAKAKKVKKEIEYEEEPLTVKEVEKLAKEKGIKTRYDDLTGEKDRFGVIIGTKTHDAVLMYEKGATSRQIQDALGEGPTKAGGRFYNILKTLDKAGHKVERSKDGIFKLTHRDDVGHDTPKRPTKDTRAGLRKRYPGKYKKP